MSGETTEDTGDKVSPRADFISALIWMAFGLSVLVASWRMDRLESQGATAYTAPGLVPGILGAIMALLGLLLAGRAARSGGHRLLSTPWRMPAGARVLGRRVGAVLGLSLVYAAGLVGHGGIPFWLATWLYVSLFILLFDWRVRSDKAEVRKGIILAMVYGAGTAFLVSYVFQEVFLGRLP